MTLCLSRTVPDAPPAPGILSTGGGTIVLAVAPPANVGASAETCPRASGCGGAGGVNMTLQYEVQVALAFSLQFETSAEITQSGTLTLYWASLVAGLPLTQQKIYSVRVIASNIVGASLPGAPADATTGIMSLPGLTSLISAAKTGGSITFLWFDVLQAYDAR